MSLIPSNSPDYSTGVGQAINAGSQIEVELASGAIGITRGTAVITKAGIAVMTLASPVAGTDDGKVLRIVSTSAFAHTVTTPALGINTTLHIATFAANVGSAIELVAYAGTWMMFNQIGITLS